MANTKDQRASSDELVSAYNQWVQANTQYLNARFRYDSAVLQASISTDGLRQDFLTKKAKVKRATEHYYAVLKKGKPVTLTALEKSALFTETQITTLKNLAQANLKLTNNQERGVE